jgi:hypothetical protein
MVNTLLVSVKVTGTDSAAEAVPLCSVTVTGVPDRENEPANWPGK